MTRGLRDSDFAMAGLGWYLDNAQSTIDKYKQNPPTTPAQFEDLAKAVTIASIGEQLSLDDEKLFRKSPYNIKINTETKTTSVNDINAVSFDNNFEDNELSIESNQLILIKQIANS